MVVIDTSPMEVARESAVNGGNMVGKQENRGIDGENEVCGATTARKCC